MPTILRTHRALAVGLLAAVLVIAAAADNGAAPPPDAAAGLAAFDTVQFDEGRTHAQLVKRGFDGHGTAGLPCATCHAARNPPASYGAHMPPGAPDWHLPPPEAKMVFIDRTPAQLCRTIKDPKETRGRDLAAMLDHVAHDELVAWGWEPGVGRAPVPIPRAQVAAAFRTWMDAGAPCPTR